MSEAPRDPLWWAQLPLSGHLLLEASAGTGKTFQITLRYLRLLVEPWLVWQRTGSGRALHVRELLVVTFTEAATEELVARIRVRLQMAVQACREVVRDERHPAPDSDALLVDYFAAQLRGDRALGERLEAFLRVQLLALDQAAIFTIHGFCQRALRDEALAAGLAFERGELLDQVALAKQVLADYWRRQSIQGSAILRHWPDGPQALWRQLRGALNHGPLLATAVPPAEALGERFRRAFAALTTPAALSELRELAGAAGAARFALKIDYQRALAVLVEILERGDPLVSWPDGLDRAALAQAQKQRPRPQATTDSEPLFAQLAELAEAQAAWWRAAAAELLLDALQHCREQMRRRARALPGFTYDDLIADLHDALHGRSADNLRRALRARWPYALIDEFQDTDARQFAIFRALWGQVDGDSGLTLIGDPKQAIYAFRGGDIEAYLQARTLPALIRLALPENQRSSGRLVQALNDFYAAAGPEPFAHRQIAYTEVRAAGRADRTPLGIDGIALVRPFTILRLPADHPARTPGEKAQAMMNECAALIANLLRPGAVTVGAAALQPGALAVLVRTNTQAIQMRSALAACGVPAVSSAADHVLLSPAADELEQFLHALTRAPEIAALRAALVTRLFGLGLAELDALERDAAGHRDWSERFWRWRVQSDRDGILAVLQPLVARLSGTHGDSRPEQRWLTDLRHLCELIGADPQARRGASAALDWLLGERAELDRDSEAGEREQRLDSDAERVQVLTVHKSKGLEYDLVFVPLAWQQPDPRRRAESLAIWHDDQGRLNIDTGSAELDAHRERAATEDLSERLRVLYVALTRARHGLWLGWVESDPADKSLDAGAAQRSALAELLDRMAAAAGESPGAGARERVLTRLCAGADSAIGQRTLDLAAAFVVRPDAVVPELIERRDWPRLPSPWRVWSFTALLRAEAGAFARQTALRDDEGDPASAGELASEDPGRDSEALPDPVLLDLEPLRDARFGQLVHRCLELIDFRAVDDVGALSALIDREMRRAGHGAALRQRHGMLIAGLLQRTLRSEIAPGLRLCALAPEQRLAELSFDLPLAAVDAGQLRECLSAHGYAHAAAGIAERGRLQGLLTGAIDLVFEQAGGYGLIDYKSNRLGLQRGDYATAALAGVIAEKGFALQYLLYSVALQRYLRQRIGTSYRYEQHFRGAWYLFVRGVGLAPGCGVFHDRPAAALLDDLDRLFDAAPAELPR